MKVGVIGAGMAGLACAQALTDAGFGVVVIDKGRGAGGRMSSRRLATSLGEVSFDHGAQYFTARTPEFVAQVGRWASDGTVAVWTGGGHDAWVGTPTMNAPVKAMAAHQRVVWSTRVETLVRTPAGWTLLCDDGKARQVDGVVVAIPAEQAADLLRPVAPDIAASARAVRSAPCWALMLAFERPLSSEVDHVRGDDASPLGWAARNSSKPGRADVEAWVVQAGAGWSAEHLETPADDVSAVMMRALGAAVGERLPSVVAQSTHRWLYARSGRDGRDAIWNDALALGVCGDWLAGPRVESAWVSGTRLAERMIAARGAGEIGR